MVLAASGEVCTHRRRGDPHGDPTAAGRERRLRGTEADARSASAELLSLERSRRGEGQGCGQFEEKENADQEGERLPLLVKQQRSGGKERKVLLPQALRRQRPCLLQGLGLRPTLSTGLVRWPK